MAADYLKMTVDTLATLPPEKQEEVYDFAEFLKANSTTKTAAKQSNKKGSVLNIIGLGKSDVSDVAQNHDKYLYEKSKSPGIKAWGFPSAELRSVLLRALPMEIGIGQPS